MALILGKKLGWYKLVEHHISVLIKCLICLMIYHVRKHQPHNTFNANCCGWYLCEHACLKMLILILDALFTYIYGLPIYLINNQHSDVSVLLWFCRVVYEVFTFRMCKLFDYIQWYNNETFADKVTRAIIILLTIICILKYVSDG